MTISLAAGCTADNRDLPTISGAPAISAQTLESVAQSFADCMTASGVSVVIQPNQLGEMTVVQPSGYNSYMYRFASGASTYYNVSDAVREEFSSWENTIPGETKPALIVDGEDRSAAFATCVGSSGYSLARATHDETPPIPADEMQAQVDANNRWAACVRENGFPDVQDTSVPSDPGQYVWFPRVTLPLSMTTDQLRMLLTQCPIFDSNLQAQAQEMQKWYDDHPNQGGYPGEIIPAPMMQFRPSPQDATLSPDEAAHRDDLLAVISEQYEQFQAGLR